MFRHNKLFFNGLSPFYSERIIFIYKCKYIFSINRVVTGLSCVRQVESPQGQSRWGRGGKSDFRSSLPCVPTADGTDRPVLANGAQKKLKLEIVNEK